MRRKKRSAIQDEDSNPFSLSLGDLMAGLLLIFILLLSSTMLTLEDIIAEKKSQLENLDERERIKKELIVELTDKLKTYGVQIDPQTGVLRMESDLLFGTNEDELSEDGKKHLHSFIPEYARILLSKRRYREQIAQLIIEGHTDDTTSFKEDKKAAYTHNLGLSLDRAQNVAEYVFEVLFKDKDKDKDKYKEDFRRLLSVNGRSFMAPLGSYGQNIQVDGENWEDRIKKLNQTEKMRKENRRVELQFRLKDWDMYDSINQTATDEGMTIER